MSLSLQVFGSSSSGNCTTFWNRHGAVLVDCGFPPRYILQRLHALGLTPSSVRAVLLTHVHGDHLHEGALHLLLQAGAALVCTEAVRNVLLARSPGAMLAEERGLLRTLRPGMQLADGISVRSFEVPHDTPGGCSGFTLVDDSGGRGARRVTFATDLGYIREGLHREFEGADAIVMESNHDLPMLEGSGRPQFLIDRIRRIGHLSNEQSSRFLAEVAAASARPPSYIMLAHLSMECNTPALALRAARSALDGAGGREVLLSAAPPRGGSRVITLQ